MLSVSIASNCRIPQNVVKLKCLVITRSDPVPVVLKKSQRFELIGSGGAMIHQVGTLYSRNDIEVFTVTRGGIVIM